MWNHEVNIHDKWKFTASCELGGFFCGKKEEEEEGHTAMPKVEKSQNRRSGPSSEVISTIGKGHLTQLGQLEMNVALEVLRELEQKHGLEWIMEQKDYLRLGLGHLATM